MDLELKSLEAFLIYCIIFFSAILFRYFVAAGFFYAYFYVWNKEKYFGKRLSKRKLRRNQLKKEIIWSIKSSVIFAFAGTLTYWLWENGLTAIYLNPLEKGIWHLPVSLVIILMIHETYYYWVHRWMHHPKVFKIVHKVHHDSIRPTPWTAFSFHPWESILEAIILPFILLIIPVNIYLLGLYLLLMTLSSVINHLDIEIYPGKLQQNWVGKLLIGATHHHYHHSEFTTNYGLYFTFWDKLMGTESSKMRDGN